MNKKDSINFKCQPFHEVGHLIAPNMKRHYNDMKIKDYPMNINADWASYIQMSEAGECIAFCAYDKNKLIAYSVFMVTPNINFKKFIEAMNTAFYIHPKYRAKLTSQYLKWINKYLLDKGVDEVAYLVADERIGKLLKRQGMKPTHTLWTVRNEQVV